MNNKTDRAWAEVNLKNIAYNYNEIKARVAAKTKVMCVVKANAYGHGVVAVSKALIKCGADRLAVACIDEAVELRKNNIDAPIQILGYSNESSVNEILDYNIIQTIYDFELARKLSDEAVNRNKVAKIHIKLDTGMGRNGFQCNAESLRTIDKISKLPGIEIEGIMTHFASADEEDSEYTLMQFNLFMQYCAELADMGINIPIKHAANSAAIINYPQMQLDMVRPGIILYGIWQEVARKPDVLLKPVMTVKARIASIKDFDKDEYISYGRTYKTAGRRKIAVVAIGYADGYPRNLSNIGTVFVNREEAPVVGTVCMDYCLVDVTNLKSNAAVGQEVILIGNEEGIRAHEIAKQLNTISYELLCGAGSRLPRVYVEDGF